jgi:hypothetical protein
MYLMSSHFWRGKAPKEWGRIEELVEFHRGGGSAGWITDEEFEYLTGRSIRKDVPGTAKRSFLGAAASGVPWVCPSDPRRKEARGQASVLRQLPPSYEWKPMSGVVARCPIHHLELLESGAVRKVPW